MSTEKFRYEYRYTTRIEICHTYILEGEKGGAHFWARTRSDAEGPRHYGGLEFHSRIGDGAPDHHACWVTGSACWHDGTSLYAEENLIPRWLAARDQDDHHEQMDQRLIYEYRRYFDENI